MLLLTRYEDERVVIRVPASSEPQVIELCVCEIIGRKVRLGFEADCAVVIDRSEIDEAKRAGVNAK